MIGVEASRVLQLPTMENDTVLAQLRENPLDEETKRKAEADHSALLDAELPGLEAKARVSGAS